MRKSRIAGIWQQLPHKGDWVCLLLITLFTTSLFLYTVQLRQPWMGKLNATTYHQSLTAATVKFADNWYKEGPLKYGLSMMENPPSVEFDTFLSRLPYASYPPGTIVPIYLLSRLLGHEPTPQLVMMYNLFTQLGIALALSWGCYLLMRQTGIRKLPSLLLGCIPAGLELMLPGPMYWHQQVFFSDQAVLLPVAVVFLTEVLLWRHFSSRLRLVLTIVQALALFWGTYTDWLMICVVPVLYGIKILTQQIPLSPKKLWLKRSFIFSLAPLIAALAYVGQLLLMKTGGIALERFMTRAALTADGQQQITNFYQQFWVGHISLSYGAMATSILMLIIALTAVISALTGWSYLRTRQVNPNQIKVLCAIWLLLLPCLTQIYLFRNHSIVHQFSALKFSLILAAIPFVLLPVLLLHVLNSSLDRLMPKIPASHLYIQRCLGTIAATTLSLILVSLSILYLHQVHKYYLPLFEQPETLIQDQGQDVARHTGFNDVVFSPQLTIPYFPPQLLAYSHKRIYEAQNLTQVDAVTHNVHQPYQALVVFTQPPTTQQLADFGQPTLISHGLLYYYRLPQPGPK